MIVERKSLLIFQRVLTPYRLELFKLLVPFYQITIITSQGDKKGSLKLASVDREDDGLNIKVLRSIRIAYKGESRSTSLFFYPQSIFALRHADVIVFEGTTNLLNNAYLVPIASLLRKKIVWWDAGYSPLVRTQRRKLIDIVAGFFIGLTNIQFAYSTVAEEYMSRFMRARNCILLLNTINTTFFEQSDKASDVDTYKFDTTNVKLLFVGAVEKRKKIDQLIEMVLDMNKKSSRTYQLSIIGGGQEKETIEKRFASFDYITFHGPIYDKDVLKNHYFESDFLILPGDGGLAIVQAIMFNLHVLCVHADGTEKDYLSRDSIFNNLTEIAEFLQDVDYLDKSELIPLKEKLYSRNWVRVFRSSIDRLFVHNET